MTPERLCIFCEHWEFDGGDPGYSDVTPGWDARMNCNKGHYGKRFSVSNMDEPDFRKQVRLAETCGDYTQVKP